MMQQKEKVKKAQKLNKYRWTMLGSKTLGLNVLELHFVMLANHDQNVQSCFRLAQSMFMCKVGIECTTRFTV